MRGPKDGRSPAARRDSRDVRALSTRPGESARSVTVGERAAYKLFARVSRASAHPQCKQRSGKELKRFTRISLREVFARGVSGESHTGSCFPNIETATQRLTARRRGRDPSASRVFGLFPQDFALPGRRPCLEERSRAHSGEARRAGVGTGMGEKLSLPKRDREGSSDTRVSNTGRSVNNSGVPAVSLPLSGSAPSQRSSVG
jgi:hypothetical protein